MIFLEIRYIGVIGNLNVQFNKTKIMRNLFFIGLFVLLYSFSFGQTSSNSTQNDTISKLEDVKKNSKFKVGFQMGYGYRTANILKTEDPLMNIHLKKLKNNLSFGADFSYLFTKNIGIGIRYNKAMAHVLTNDISYKFADGVINYNYLSELVGINYVGPFLATQLFIKPNNNCLFANVGIGYVRCSHNAVLVKEDTKTGHFTRREIANIAKNSVAFVAETGYDFFVKKNLAIGLYISATVDLLNVELARMGNLSHIDVSLGFRFYQ